MPPGASTVMVKKVKMTMRTIYLRARRPMTNPEPLSFDVAETKKRFSELIARVAFGGATVLITRRGRPMARLVPAEPAGQPRHLADVVGWLDDHSPFLAAVDTIVAARAKHRPRVLANRTRPSRRRPGR
jgi:prevent-host-death family protein